MIIKKRLKTLSILLSQPKILRRGLKNLFHHSFEDFYLYKSKIPSLSYEELFPECEVSFNAFQTKNGRVSLYELTVLCSLIKQLKPKKILEIGTFDGMTAYHLAKNSLIEAHIWTLDLPFHAINQTRHSKEDLEFIKSLSRSTRKFHRTDQTNKITELWGDSRDITFPESMDFIFIDGGHDRECILNDSLKSLSCLADGGTIVWHDYSPHTPDVFFYLNSMLEPLVHIKETSLVIYQKKIPSLES